MRVSVHPSVCLSRRSTAAKACSWFATERGLVYAVHALCSKAGSVMLRAEVRGSAHIVCWRLFRVSKKRLSEGATVEGVYVRRGGASVFHSRERTLLNQITVYGIYGLHVPEL